MEIIQNQVISHEIKAYKDVKKKLYSIKVRIFIIFVYSDHKNKFLCGNLFSAKTLFPNRVIQQYHAYSWSMGLWHFLFENANCNEMMWHEGTLWCLMGLCCSMSHISLQWNDRSQMGILDLMSHASWQPNVQSFSFLAYFLQNNATLKWPKNTSSMPKCP